MKATIKKLVANELNCEPTDISDNIELVLDSLATVQLAMALEEEFGIEVPDEDYTKLKTVNKIEKYVREATERKG